MLIYLDFPGSGAFPITIGRSFLISALSSPVISAISPRRMSLLFISVFFKVLIVVMPEADKQSGMPERKKKSGIKKISAENNFKGFIITF